MAKEQNPLERVAREMAEHCEMSESEIAVALRGLMVHVRTRAAKAVVEETDPDPEALLLAQQYWALSELIGQFGTALLAFDDMDGAGGIVN